MISKLVAWVIIITSVYCFLHASNQIFLRNSECPSTTTTTAVSDTNISAFENIETNNRFISLPSNSTTSSISDESGDQKTTTTDLALPKEEDDEEEQREQEEEATKLKHIVFGIAGSSDLWDKRKVYIKQWWRPDETRGAVWLDNPVETNDDENLKLPDIHISADTSNFRYTNSRGSRSALRISRVISETLSLDLPDVRWFVMGDDDTVFIVDNVVRILSKYDHRQLYYIGSNSESHVQNIIFTYAMAYGGGGFAISYPLAKELAKMQDRCINRYPALYGSDDRIQACMAELGIPLTKELGFHQVLVIIFLLGSIQFSSDTTL